MRPAYINVVIRVIKFNWSYFSYVKMQNSVRRKRHKTNKKQNSYYYAEQQLTSGLDLRSSRNTLLLFCDELLIEIV